MPIRPPRPVIAVSAVVALAAATLLAPAPALAAPTEPAPSGDVPLGPVQSVSTARIFSEVPIPSGIAELSIEYPDDAGPIDCTLTTGSWEEAIGWRQDPPVAGGDVIDVLYGPIVPGGRYLLYCLTAEGDDEWTLVASDEPAASAVISAIDSPYFSRIDESVRYGSVDAVVALGGSFRFVAEPAALPAGDVFGLMSYSADEFEAMSGSVTADGSAAVMTAPIWEEFFYGHDVGHRTWGVSWDVQGPAGTREGVPVVRWVRWSGTLTTLPAESSVRIAASSSIATSFQRVKAIIRVTAPSVALEDWYPDQPERGAITVKVDGRVVTTLDRMAGVDRYVVTLPRLSRGTHRVTAEYGGWTWIAPSTSTATVRILI